MSSEPGDQPVAKTSREVEAKFRVHPPYVLPSLLGGRAKAVDPPRDEELRAVYWDTNDLRLAREGVTMRRRVGEGEDRDGWHLKLPIREGRVPDASIGARVEVHADGPEDNVPADLRDLVVPWVRTAVIGPVATLVTNRTAYVVRDKSGSPLVELTDDLVSVLSAGHVAGRFREIEVEDRGGGVAAIEAVGDLLRASGAVGGEFLPKVVRALGPQATADPDPPTPVGVDVDDPARAAVREILRRYVRDLLGGDVAVRRGQPDAVHQLRVTARRLRSVLRTFAPLLDPEWSASLVGELKWLADAMADARDSEVLLERLDRDLAELPADLVVGPVQAALAQRLGAALETGGGQALETLRSERYVVLLERLVDAAWEPMTSTAAESPAGAALRPLLADIWRQVARGVKRLGRPESTVEDWHKVRILAKQLRYTCDAAEPIFGKPARRLSRQAREIQEVLGEHQDAVVAADLLRSMAALPAAGTVAFTLGLLHSRQTEAAESARAAFWPVWATAKRSRYRRWLAT